MELLEFKRTILATTERKVGTMDPDASVEVQKTDLKALHAEALRFERRLVYWRAGSRSSRKRPATGPTDQPVAISGPAARSS